jgi:hypothetical protein
MSDGDRSDVAPKGLGFDLAKIAKGGAIRPSHETCPGALLVVTRDEYDQMVSGGEVFVTPRRDVDPERRSDARLFCKGTVLREERMGVMYFMALCASCTEAERRMRELARKRVENNGR